MLVNEYHRVRTRAEVVSAVRELNAKLRRGESGSGIGEYAAILARNPHTAAVVCNSSEFTLQEAVALARSLADCDRNFTVHLLKQSRLNGAGRFTADQVTCRVLELVAAVGVSELTMPILLQMLRQAEDRVLSKLVLLVGRIRPDPACLGIYSLSPDDRIRANTVEALWGNRDAESIRLFDAASRDHHQRVAANGLVGLFLAGDDSVAFSVARMAGDEAPLRRAAAAWAIGKIASAELMTTLRQLASDGDARVRGAALRALVQVRNPAKPGAPALASR